MKYFVILSVLLVIIMVTINPMSAQCVYDPNNPHTTCVDTREILILTSPSTQIENIDGVLYYVSEPFMSNLSVEKIIFQNVTFSAPYKIDPPRHTYSDVVFSDGTKETLSILFDEPYLY